MATSEDWINFDIDDEFQSIVEPYFNNEIEQDELLEKLRIFKTKYKGKPSLKGIVQEHIMINAINIPLSKEAFAKVYPRQFPAEDNTFLEVLKIFIPSARAEQINKIYIQEQSTSGGRRTKLRKRKRRRTKKVKRSKRKKYRSKRRKRRRSRSRR